MPIKTAVTTWVNDDKSLRVSALSYIEDAEDRDIWESISSVSFNISPNNAKWLIRDLEEYIAKYSSPNM